MDWLVRMNGAVCFIEENLTEEINFEDVAKIACCSVYHFQRMFSFIADVPLSEYIRRRRLTFAAFELQNSDIKVIDLAVKYGYDSPISFTRAFKNQHGVTPSLARDKGVQLKAYPRMSFHIIIKGDVEMNYKIVEKEAFNVIGKCMRASTNADENGITIPSFWDECMKNGTYDVLCKNCGEMGVLGVCMDDWDTEMNTFSYLAAIEDNGNSLGEGFVKEKIDESTWAVFESIGPVKEVTKHRWKRIMTEWFPTSGYQQRKMPVVEAFTIGDMDSSDYRCEMWVPIVKG